MKKFTLICAALFSLLCTVSAENSFNELDMVQLPAGNFIIGQDVQSYTAARSVDAFAVNRYETPYTLWYQIRKEAEKISYRFANPGQEGSRGRRGKAPSAKLAGQPVTMISWYDAIVWCNAFSEICGLQPCYTYKNNVLKDSSMTAECDLAECDFSSTGFRLPTEAEWEYAARYSEKGLQKGTKASGDISTGTDDNSEKYAWISSNAESTMICGTAGTPFAEDAPAEPGTGNSNGAGLFDMSGNVMEFCWDWFADYSEQADGQRAFGPSIGSQRVSRGGSWSEYTMFCYCGDRYSYDASECYDYMGFRFVQSLQK